MERKIKTHVCQTESELFALIGGVKAAFFQIRNEPFKVTTMVNGNECHVYLNDDGIACVDEVVEAN